jgi:hypothetical protein
LLLLPAGSENRSRCLSIEWVTQGHPPSITLHRLNQRAKLIGGGILLSEYNVARSIRCSKTHQRVGTRACRKSSWPLKMGNPEQERRDLSPHGPPLDAEERFAALCNSGGGTDSRLIVRFWRAVVCPILRLLLRIASEPRFTSAAAELRCRPRRPRARGAHPPIPTDGPRAAPTCACTLHPLSVQTGVSTAQSMVGP